MSKALNDVGFFARVGKIKVKLVKDGVKLSVSSKHKNKKT
jgi:hypothetical protein